MELQYSQFGQSEYVTNIATLFKNVTLNALGVKRSFYQCLADTDVDRAISMMQNHDTDVDNALKEYYPQKHKIMERPNKPRKGMSPYITCKLPRALQKYINEVELFFLLGQPIKWKKEEGDDEAYALFTDYLRDSRFNANIRKAKRMAGSETESAKLYHMYRDEVDGQEQVIVKPVILSRSTGYQLRPLFDQYGEMLAFAYGYKTKESNGQTTQHWDIHTKEVIFECEQATVGWRVRPRPNTVGRICVLYYHQDKAWAGVEPRINRIEELDSKIGDSNNYFAEPTAIATADVIELMKDPDVTGRLLKATGPNSRYEYINPPAASELRAQEKKDLHDTVLFDTMTPDLDVEKMRGTGTLSGIAIERAMTLGNLKRSNLLETYEEMVDREKNVIIACLKEQHPEMAAKLDTLKISFEFMQPFGEDKRDKWQAIASLYTSGLVSLETAVYMLALTDAPEEEIDRIRMAQTEKLMAEQELKEEQAQANAPAGNEESESD